MSVRPRKKIEANVSINKGLPSYFEASCDRKVYANV